MIGRVLSLALLAAAPAGAAAERYAATFAGAPVMTLSVDLVERDGAYRASVRAEGDILAAIDARLSGSDADGVRRYEFDAEVGGWRQKTTVETLSGAAPKRVYPARGARIPAPLGALDPIAAYVTALRAAADGRCPAAMTIFDGWRTITVAFYDATPVDAAPERFRCAFDVDTDVAGGADPHRLDALIDAGEAVFAPGPNGRARLETLQLGPPIFGLRLNRIADNPPPPKPRPTPPLEGQAL